MRVMCLVAIPDCESTVFALLAITGWFFSTYTSIRHIYSVNDLYSSTCTQYFSCSKIMIKLKIT